MTRVELALLECIESVNELYGFYLDSVTGFEASVRAEIARQEHFKAMLPPGTDQDALAFAYGTGHPASPDARVQHRTTQGEYKRRNQRGGANHIRAAQLLIVLLAVYWDTEHRLKIARAMELRPARLRVPPLLQDLVLLRNAVVHHQGVITADTARKLLILKTYKAGASILMGHEEVQAFIEAIKATVRSLPSNQESTE
jgi:hypothetical protein